MKKIFLIIINVLTISLVFSESFEVYINKNTYFTDDGDNNLEYVTKGTVLTVDSDTVEFGRVYSDENAENAKLEFYGDGNSKSLYLRDISVNNKSEYLPKGVIGSTYTMNYYLNDIYYNTYHKQLFIHESYLEDCWYEKYRDEDYGYEHYFPVTFKIFNGFYIEDNDSFAVEGYHRNSLFIKDIKQIEDGFILNIIPIAYMNFVLPLYKNVLEQRNSNLLKFQFDGDYLYIYKDGRLVFELVKTNKDTQEQIGNYYVDQECDLQKITWPRHADGTCDYDDIKTTTNIKVK